MNYRLSEAADADLLAILVEGVERFGIDHAVSYRRSLEQVFERLVDFPEMARLREEIVPPIRAYPHRPFVIIYDVEPSGDVLIQRIRHGREDWLSDPING